MLTILKMSFQNPQLTGYLLTGKGVTFSLQKALLLGYMAFLFFSPLYGADKCLNRIPIYFHYTVMYINPVKKLSILLPLYPVIKSHRLSYHYILIMINTM